MKPIHIIYLALTILLMIGVQAYSQINTGNTSLPTGSYGKKDTFAAKDLDRPINTNGVTRETIRVERNANRNADEAERAGNNGDGVTQSGENNAGYDTAYVGDGTNVMGDTTQHGMETTIGDNSSCANQTSLYIAIVLLTIALLVGAYILNDVFKNIPANQIAGSAYSVLLPISTAIVAFFTMHCTGPAKGLIALVIAVALGLPMFFMRTASKQSPKWLIAAHSFFAVAGYVLLIAYVVSTR